MPDASQAVDPPVSFTARSRLRAIVSRALGELTDGRYGHSPYRRLIEPDGDKERETGMNGTTRTATFKWILTLVALVAIGLATVHEADARKFTVKATTSIKDRVQAQRDMCATIGGGTLTVTSGYVTTTTSCSGGTEDGTNCSHTRNETTCTTPERTKPAPSLHGDITIDIESGIDADSAIVDSPVSTEAIAVVDARVTNRDLDKE